MPISACFEPLQPMKISSRASEPRSEVPCTAPYAALIGVDWSHGYQYFTLRSCAPKVQFETGKFLLRDLSSWILPLRQRFGPAKIAIAVEQNRTALIHALMEHADLFDIYVIHTTALAHYRQAFRSSGAKADDTDADVIEDILFHHREKLRLWQPDDTHGRLLTAYCQQRRELVNRRNAFCQQMIEQLRLCYPVALDLELELTSAMALALLQRWPCQKQLQAATAAKLKAFFYLHHVRQLKHIEAKLAIIARGQALITDQAVLEPAQLQLSHLVRLIRDLNMGIDDYDKRIAQLYAQHCDANIFSSLPGAGKVMAPRLACALGKQLQRWKSPQDLQRFSGMAPVRVASGKSFIVHRRYACPKFIRQTFHEFSAHSLKYCPWAKALYQRQMASGKSHHTAIRAVGFRWIRIIWRMWHDKVPYDETVFNAAQEAHARR